MVVKSVLLLISLIKVPPLPILQRRCCDQPKHAPCKDIYPAPIRQTNVLAIMADQDSHCKFASFSIFLKFVPAYTCRQVLLVRATKSGGLIISNLLLARIYNATLCFPSSNLQLALVPCYRACFMACNTFGPFDSQLLKVKSCTSCFNDKNYWYHDTMQTIPCKITNFDNPGN